MKTSSAVQMLKAGIWNDLKADREIHLQGPDITLTFTVGSFLCRDSDFTVK